MGRVSFVPLIMLMVNVLLGSVGQVFLKKGASSLQALHANQGIVASLVDSFKGIFTPYIFTGFCLYAVSSVLWIRILRQVNLSVAYPMISLSYVLVSVLSYFVFSEKISWQAAVGLMLICAGVSLIGFGHGTVR